MDLASAPLYAELDASERADLAPGTRLLSFRAGEALMRQGAKPDGLYVILAGQVQVTTRLPGGGETMIAERGAGSILGELALIQSTVRTATVTAMGPVEALCADWSFLTAALTQRRPGAFKVFRRLALLLAERLRVMHDSIRQATVRYDMLRLPAVGAPEGGMPEGFDAAAFLPVLPCFRGFEAADIDAVRRRARVIDPKRGMPLVALDEVPGHGYIVVRGAVASGFGDGGGIHLLNVRGPGSFCAVSPLLEHRPASAALVVCENAVLLEIPRDDFLELLRGDDRTAGGLLTAVIGHQAGMVSRTTNHLKRLVGLSRMFLTGSADEPGCGAGPPAAIPTPQSTPAPPAK